MASIFKRGAKWRAQIRRAGHATLTETFTSKADAQRWAREQEVQIDKSIRTPAGLRMTFGELAEAYLKELSRKKVGATKLNTIKRLQTYFQDYRLQEINKRIVLNYIQTREDQNLSPVSLMTDFTYLRTVLKYGGAIADVEEATALALIQVQAARDVLRHSDRLNTGIKRERRPTEAELRLLKGEFARQSNQRIPMWDIVLFAICTAMRLGEIVKIRWEDFDEPKRMVLVRDRKDPKNKKGNDANVPLLKGPVYIENKNIDPVKIILRQPRSSEKIFPFFENKVSFAFTSAVKSCGIDNLRFHDLRHDGISRLFEAGYQIQEVSMVSGHKTWEHLKRYTNLNPERLHR